MKTHTASILSGTTLADTYAALKAGQPAGTVVLMRVGDFYEVFGEDAKRVAAALVITLTKRKDVPMCGVPAWALDSNVKTLQGAGFTLVVAEPFGAPAPLSQLS